MYLLFCFKKLLDFITTKLSYYEIEFGVKSIVGLSNKTKIIKNYFHDIWAYTSWVYIRYRDSLCFPARYWWVNVNNILWHCFFFKITIGCWQYAQPCIHQRACPPSWKMVAILFVWCPDISRSSGLLKSILNSQFQFYSSEIYH